MLWNFDILPHLYVMESPKSVGRPRYSQWMSSLYFEKLRSTEQCFLSIALQHLGHFLIMQT